MHLITLAWDVDRPGEPDPAVLRTAGALTAAGHSCEVITLGTGPTSTRALAGVDVTWVAEAAPVLPPDAAYDTARVLAVATRASAAAEQRAQRRAPDAVIAHGWQTTWTATTLRSSRGVPIVAVLDSTAPGRADGDLDDLGRHAAQVEWWLTYEARRVVAPSTHVARDLRRSYRLPTAKVDVVRPGVDPVAPVAAATDVLVAAPDAVVRAVRRAVGPTRVTTDRGEVSTCAVAVVLDDDASTALQAMAAGAVVVLDEHGPLRELVHARRSGLRTPLAADAVVATVQALLADPDRRRRLGERARRRVAERHDRDTVVGQLADVCERAVAEEAELRSGTPEHPPLRPLLLRSPMLGLVADD